MRAITWISRLGAHRLAAALLFGAVVVAVAPAGVGRSPTRGRTCRSTLPAFQPLAQPTHVYDADGNVIAMFQRQNSQPIALAKIPEPVRRAFLAVEDREFYPHNGVNVRSLVRATLSNFASDVPQQGASTITMQVAKNDFLGGLERDGRYKVLQIHYAMMLENQYTKDQILERYLNTVFFGNNAYGIQAAAETYFGKTVDQLTFIEAAFLAGLVRSPSGYDPIDNPERSRARFAQVLDRLVDAGEMTEAEAQATLDTFVLPARVQTRRADQPDLPRTYYTEALRDYLLNRSNLLGDDVRASATAALYRGGLRIHTTLTRPPADGRGGPRRAARHPAGLRRGDRLARHEHRGDRGDGRRPRLRARRERGQHGPRPAPDRVEHKLFILAAALQAGRPARRRHRRPAPCVLPNPGEPSEPFEIQRRRRAASPTRCGR